LDTLVGMQLFLRVAQTGSFSAAGRQVGLSPPTVFRAINALEDNVGARLLNRSSRRLTLTEAGTLYAARIETILAEIDDTNAELGQLQLTPRGTLRVHARVSLGVHHLAPLLPIFLIRHPEVDLDLRLSDTALDFAEANIDVAIRVGDVSGATLVKRKLVASPRIVCASPDYLARRGTPGQPGDLLGHNCLTFRSEENQPMWRFLKDGQLTELRVTGSLRSEHGDVLRQAALGGLGVVLLPAWSVGEDLLAGRLTGLLLDHEATPFGFDPDLYVITHRVRHRALKVRLFLDFLHEAFAAKKAWADIKQTLIARNAA
jgi:DNA-binding transcriptional LysR family regulator